MKLKIIVEKSIFIIVLILLIVGKGTIIRAESSKKQTKNQNVYYINQDDTEFYNAGDDKGYAKKDKVDSKDPHYGWSLGKFVIKGYTSKDNENKENPVFLKTIGDNIIMSFELEQDINKLNGDNKQFIVNDKKGFDEGFGTEKTNFGKGTLLIRHTDPNNKKDDPIIYTNFLTGKSKDAKDMTLILHEEGEYEIALDYMIENSIIKPFGKSLGFHDSYRWYFKFTVQNGNDMGFLFENETKRELKNCSFSEKGFYIDLANSKYLDVQVKREELNDNGTQLVEDTRSNKVASDGESFKEEGIYTITIKNRYVDEPTIKRIYVGDDDILKAYIITGKSIPEIRKLVDDGAKISDDGTIVISKKQQKLNSKSEPQNKGKTELLFLGITGVILIGMTIVFTKYKKYRK